MISSLADTRALIYKHPSQSGHAAVLGRVVSPRHFSSSSLASSRRSHSSCPSPSAEPSTPFFSDVLFVNEQGDLAHVSSKRSGDEIICRLASREGRYPRAEGMKPQSRVQVPSRSRFERESPTMASIIAHRARNLIRPSVESCSKFLSSPSPSPPPAASSQV